MTSYYHTFVVCLWFFYDEFSLLIKNLSNIFPHSVRNFGIELD